MKNIFRFLMAVAVLFTASCAKEDISSSIGSGEVEMTFTVDLQDLGSRAYGDGTQVNTLRYYVYDGNSYLDQLSGQKPIAVGAATTVNLVLLKGMTYNIVFWADHDGYYTYDTAAKTITVDYSTVTAYHSATDHHNSIDIADRTSCCGMETHAHRLHKGACTSIQPLSRDDLGPWKGHLLPHRAVSLHSESLVELACIRPSVPA